MSNRGPGRRVASIALVAVLGLFPVSALAEDAQSLLTDSTAVTEKVEIEAGTRENSPSNTSAPSKDSDSTDSTSAFKRPSEQNTLSDEKKEQETASASPSVTEKQEPAPDSQQSQTDSSENVEKSATSGSTNEDAPTDSPDAADPADDSTITMSRIYNQWTGEHLFTSSTSERDSDVELGWTDEGVGWQAPKSSSTPVYRLYNPYSGDHHFTTSADEYSSLGTIGWKQEGVGFYSEDDHVSGFVVYRLFNPYVSIGTHHYTLSKSEYDYLGTIGWNKEGTGWYATDASFCIITASVTDSSGATQDVVSTTKDGITYLVLPSYANASSVNVGVSANGTGLDATLNLPSHDASVSAAGTNVDLSRDLGSTASYATRRGTHPLVILKSGDVGTIFVTSVDPAQNRAWVEASKNHSAKASVDILMVASDGSLVYNKDGKKHSTIKGRGNNTWGYGNKKPYQISLSKKTDLLQTGNEDNANKKWVLLANENDATLLHDTLAYDMGLELDLVGCEGTPIDLYYDGEYRGSYYLCEKVEIKDGRVDIHNLEDDVEKANKDTDLDALPTAKGTYTSDGRTYTFQYVEGVKDPKDITGGYLVEKDGAYYAKETCWFETSIGIFVVKSPEVASQNQVRYIAEQIQAAINAMYEGKFNLNDQASFDLDSLSKSYLVNEFTKNIDFFFTSTYFYKDKGSNVIYAEPLWDFDGSMGVRTDDGDANFKKYSGYSVPGGAYINTIPSIWKRAQEVWKQELSPLMANVVLGDSSAVGSNGFLHSLSYYRNQISASQAANQALFGMGHFGNEFAPFPTYEENYRYLVDWLTWRTEWFNKYFANSEAPENHTSVYNGTDYGLVYDYDYYVENHPEVTETAGTGEDAVLAYFVEKDLPHGVRASLNFDPVTYKTRYADLADTYGDNWIPYYEHFMTSGFYEGRRAA